MVDLNFLTPVKIKGHDGYNEIIDNNINIFCGLGHKGIFDIIEAINKNDSVKSYIKVIIIKFLMYWYRSAGLEVENREATADQSLLFFKLYIAVTQDISDVFLKNNLFDDDVYNSLSTALSEVRRICNIEEKYIEKVKGLYYHKIFKELSDD